MKRFKAIYREKDGYDKLTIYKDDRNKVGKKIAEVSEEPNGFSRRARIDFLLMSLLNSMMGDMKVGELFSDAEFEITYEDKYTKEMILFKTRKESLIRGFSSFQTTLF